MADGNRSKERELLSRRAFLSLSKSSLVVSGGEILGAVLGIKLMEDETRSEQENPPLSQPESNLGAGIRWHTLQG